MKKIIILFVILCQLGIFLADHVRSIDDHDISAVHINLEPIKTLENNTLIHEQDVLEYNNTETNYKDNLEMPNFLSICVIISHYLSSILTINMIIQSRYIALEIDHFFSIVSIVMNWMVYQHQSYIWTIIHAFKCYNLIFFVRFLAVYALRKSGIIARDNQYTAFIEILVGILSIVYYTFGPFIQFSYSIIHILASWIFGVYSYDILGFRASYDVIIISFTTIGYELMLLPFYNIYPSTFKDMNQIRANLKLYFSILGQQSNDIMLLLFAINTTIGMIYMSFIHIFIDYFSVILFINFLIIAFYILNRDIVASQLIFVCFGPFIASATSLKAFRNIFPSYRNNNIGQHLAFLLGAIAVYLVNIFFGSLSMRVLFTLSILTFFFHIKSYTLYDMEMMMITFIMYPILGIFARETTNSFKTISLNLINSLNNFTIKF